MKYKIKKAFLHPPKTLTGNYTKLVQFFRFGVAGSFSAALEIGTLLLFVNIFFINYLISNAIAFIAANILNYLFCRYWVYGESKYVIGIEVTTFFVTGTVGLLINQMVLYLMYDKFSLPLIVSKVFAIAITVVWNFLSKKHIVFKY